MSEIDGGVARLTVGRASARAHRWSSGGPAEESNFTSSFDTRGFGCSFYVATVLYRNRRVERVRHYTTVDYRYRFGEQASRFGMRPWSALPRAASSAVPAVALLRPQRGFRKRLPAIMIIIKHMNLQVGDTSGSTEIPCRARHGGMGRDAPRAEPHIRPELMR